MVVREFHAILSETVQLYAMLSKLNSKFPGWYRSLLQLPRQWWTFSQFIWVHSLHITYASTSIIAVYLSLSGWAWVYYCNNSKLNPQMGESENWWVCSHTSHSIKWNKIKINKFSVWIKLPNRIRNAWSDLNLRILLCVGELQMRERKYETRSLSDCILCAVCIKWLSHYLPIHIVIIYYCDVLHTHTLPLSLSIVLSLCLRVCR